MRVFGETRRFERADRHVCWACAPPNATGGCTERSAREQLDASGLVRRRESGSGSYDYFRGRLMFPIHNESGKVIAFGGRAMRDEDQPKYLNSPETPLYKKTSVLYNLHRARDGMRRADRAVLQRCWT